MKPVPFNKLPPHIKNVVMNQWIKSYINKGLTLEDAQYAARWRAGHWKLNARMEKVLADIEDV
jgi:hypothetical protein